MFSQRFVISVLALVALVIPAAATTTTYTDPTTFNTATASLFFTYANFNTAIFDSVNGYTDASGVVFNDSGQNTSGLAISSTCFNTCTDGEVTDRFLGFSISLPNNIVAFALYIAVQNSEPITVAFSGNGVASSTTLTPGTGYSSPVFFGVTTDAPITNLTITGTTFFDTIALDNFQTAPASAPATTAEAAPFLLIGSGLIFLRLLRRRRQALAAA